MSFTWNGHFIPDKDVGINLDTSIQEIITSREYRHFLARSVAGVLDRISMNKGDIIGEYLGWEGADYFWTDIYHQNVRGALSMENASKRKPISFHDAWNSHGVPVICGKLHELKGTPVGECKMRGRDVCGHPEISWLYHALGTGGFIASMLSQKHHNPGPAITKPIVLDNRAGKLRQLIKIAPVTFFPIHVLVKLNEQMIWQRTILPFRRRVVATLQKHNFIPTN